MCGTSGKDGMRDLLSVFSDHESSPGDRGNRFLEPGACRAVSDGCGGQSVSVDSLHGQLVLCGGDSEYPKRTGMASCDHMDLGGGDLCLHLIYQTARNPGCGGRNCTCRNLLCVCGALEENGAVFGTVFYFPSWQPVLQSWQVSLVPVM